jgi:hypothetical protein
MGRKRHNCEKRLWKGISYRKTGELIISLKSKVVSIRQQIHEYESEIVIQKVQISFKRDIICIPYKRGDEPQKVEKT